MKNFKRLFAIVLSVALLLCSVPMMVSADVDTVPELNNTYTALAGIDGKINQVTVPAGNNMYSSGSGAYRMAGWLPDSGFDANDTAKVEFVEVDVYVSSATSSIGFWVTDNWDASTTRKKISLGSLEAGWNHKVIAFPCAAGYTWNSIFWEGTPSSEVDVTVAYANLYLTAENPIPDMRNEKIYTVDSVENVFWTKSGIAGGYSMPPTGSDNNASWYGHLSTTYDTTSADFAELEIYSNVAVTTYVWVSSAAWADNGRARMESGFDLEAGWNHVVVDLNNLGITSGTLDRTAVKNIFLNLTTPTDASDVTLKMGNLAFTTDTVPTPEKNNTYNDYAEVSFSNQQFSGAMTVPAGTSLYPSYQWWSQIVPVTIPEEAYIEMDLYASAPTNSFSMWSATDGVASRGRWTIPALEEGWNHVVIDVTETATANGGWTAESFTEWSGCFFEGTLSSTEDVYLKRANVWVTTAQTSSGEGEGEEGGEVSTDPEVVPTPAYTANVVQTSAADLKGSKTNSSDERYMTWTEYSEGFADMMENPLDITSGDYIEFDFYSDVKGSGSISLGSLNPSNGFQFYDNRSQKKSFSFEIGWNHIVLTTDGNFRSIDTTTLKTYTPTAVTGFILHGFSSCGYIRLTNIAVTRETPIAETTYENPIIDYSDSLNFEKTWAAGVTDIYNVVANRAFISLGKTIDITKAEFIEFDVYISAEMNDLNMWICNSYDAPGRFRNTIKFSELTPGQWNHVVWDLTDIAYTEGTMDKTRWTSVFFQGGPTADLDHEVTFKVANLGCSKSYPDMDTTHTLVAAAIDGVHKAATVPADTALYPTYQMYGTFDAIDMANVDFIELDIYVSEPVAAGVKFHTHTDGATLRGYWLLPALETGWNHVVLDKVEDYGGSNSGMTIDQLTSWSGFFFEGKLSTENEVYIKVANVATTKFAPDPEYVYIEVTSHPEIYVDVTGAEGAYAGEGAFASAVDFSKGDTLELDVYSEEGATDVTVTLTDVNGVTATLTIPAADLTAGWNHVVVDLAGIVANDGFVVKSVASIGFSGADDLRFVFANLALTAEEAVKLDMEYLGKVYNTFAGYTEATIPAAGDISEVVDPITLPWAVDVSNIDYIEMNLYVSAKCDLTFNLNATPFDEEGVYEEANAYYVLEGLTYGWNQLHIPVADLTANEWYDPTCVTYIYFSGVPAATYDVTFTVEDLALTTNAIDFDIAAGDYNVDGAVDMVDLIHVVNTTLAAEGAAFANVAEVEGAADYVIDALDIAALRKVLFAAF